jgi:hypothetical protein
MESSRLTSAPWLPGPDQKPRCTCTGGSKSMVKKTFQGLTRSPGGSAQVAAKEW